MQVLVQTPVSSPRVSASGLDESSQGTSNRLQYSKRTGSVQHAVHVNLPVEVKSNPFLDDRPYDRVCSAQFGLYDVTGSAVCRSLLCFCSFLIGRKLLSCKRGQVGRFRIFVPSHFGSNSIYTNNLPCKGMGS